MMPGAADNFVIHITGLAFRLGWPVTLQTCSDIQFKKRLLISLHITLTSSLGSSGLAYGLGAANNLIILFK